MDEQREPTFRDLVALLRRGLVFALAVGIGAAVLTFLLTKRAVPTYDATATVLASQPDSGLQGFNVHLVTAPSLDVSAYQAAATSTPVLTKALQQVGQGSPTERELAAFAKHVSVKTTANQKSSLINLTVNSPDPKLAAGEANALSKALLDWDKQRASNNLATVVDTLKAQIASLDAQIAQVQTADKGATSQLSGLQQLRAQQALQLNAAEALQTSAVGHLEVLQPAVLPFRPSAPHPARSAVLAFIVGILVIYGLLLLRDALDTRFRDTGDLAAEAKLPVLAEFPRMHGGIRHLPREAANFLRTNVLFATSDSDPKVLLVTSAGVADGKSSVAMSLAESFARSDYRTLLVDADLRNPVTGKEYRLNMLEHTPLRSYLEDPRLPLEPAHVAIDHRVLDVVPTFKPAPSPTDLLSHGFADFLSRLRDRYDVIVVDSAPIMPVADTLAIAPQATGVLFAVSLPDNDRRSGKAALELLTRIGARVVGCVATNLEYRGSRGDYGYGYGYGYGPPETTRTATGRATVESDSRGRGDNGQRHRPRSPKAPTRTVRNPSEPKDRNGHR